MKDIANLIAVINAVNSLCISLFLTALASKQIWSALKDKPEFKRFQKIVKLLTNLDHGIVFSVIINKRIIYKPSESVVEKGCYHRTIWSIVKCLEKNPNVIDTMSVKMIIYNQYTKNTNMFSNNNVIPNLEYQNSPYQNCGITQEVYTNIREETIAGNATKQDYDISMLNKFQINIDRKVCTFLWCRFLSELVEVKIRVNTLDLSNNDIHELPGNFGNLVTTRIILTGNNFTLPTEKYKNHSFLVLDWVNYPSNIQKDKIEWLKRNPAHITYIQKCCNYRILFEKHYINDCEIWRFIGLKNGLGNLTDNQSFQLLIDVHQYCRNTEIVRTSCNVDPLRVLIGYEPKPEQMNALNQERQNNSDFTYNFKDFVICQ